MPLKDRLFLSTALLIGFLTLVGTVDMVRGLFEP